MHISNQEKQPKSGQPSIPVLSAVISKNQTINTTQIAGLKKKERKPFKCTAHTSKNEFLYEHNLDKIADSSLYRKSFP